MAWPVRSRWLRRSPSRSPRRQRAAHSRCPRPSTALVSPKASQSSSDRPRVQPMRLVSFRHADAAKIGAVVEGGIVDLSGRTSSRWPSLRDAIAAKALPALAAPAKGPTADLSFDGVELSPAIPNPDKILCIGLNYAAR